MAKIVNVDEFASAIVEEIKKYTTDVEEALDEELINVANEGKQQLRNLLMPDTTGQDSPPANKMTRRQWKNYSKGWRVKVDRRNNYIKGSIYNATDWQLTHLLEYGHATSKGTYTRKFEHIKPIEEFCVNKINDNTIKIIEKGGKL